MSGTVLPPDSNPISLLFCSVFLLFFKMMPVYKLKELLSKSLKQLFVLLWLLLGTPLMEHNSKGETSSSVCTETFQISSCEQPWRQDRGRAGFPRQAGYHGDSLAKQTPSLEL